MTIRRTNEGPPPRRKWGQNFLADSALAESLVRRFEPLPDDRIVEIGPGRGALTAFLAPQAGRFCALEVDPLLIGPLEELLAPWSHATVRLGDAMDANWDELADELGGPLRVIGNLPYNVGTPIVRRLLAVDSVLDIQAVLQLEVVERFLANEGTKAYGPLSVIAALRSERKKLKVLEPGAFRPRPKVRSAAMRLTIRPDALLPPLETIRLERWLFAGFAHRRKTLAGNLGAFRPRVRSFLEEHGLPADARAESLPPELWLQLSHLLDRWAAE